MGEAYVATRRILSSCRLRAAARGCCCARLCARAIFYARARVIPGHTQTQATTQTNNRTARYGAGHTPLGARHSLAVNAREIVVSVIARCARSRALALYVCAVAPERDPRRAASRRTAPPRRLLSTPFPAAPFPPTACRGAQRIEQVDFDLFLADLDWDDARRNSPPSCDLHASDARAFWPENGLRLLLSQCACENSRMRKNE